MQALQLLARAVVAIGAVLTFAAPAAAQSAAPPDLSGFWINQYTPDLSVALGKQPPFTEFGAERWRTVDTAKDPTAICLPVGPSRGFTAPFPFMLVQHDKMIAIMFEYQAIWRAIYLDGRAHPDDLADYPYFMGHSIGRWEGDTLVVDTQGIDERSWLDTAGHEHSAKLRLTERFKKTGPDTIQWTVTYDDPGLLHAAMVDRAHVYARQAGRSRAAVHVQREQQGRRAPPAVSAELELQARAGAAAGEEAARRVVAG